MADLFEHETEARWVAAGKNKRAGYIRYDAQNGLWRGQNGAGAFTAASEREAELAICAHPAQPPRRGETSRPKPTDHSLLTSRDAGFIVRNDAGREIGGAIGRPGGRFDAFALGEPIGQFANEGKARAAITHRRHTHRQGAQGADEGAAAMRAIGFKRQPKNARVGFFDLALDSGMRGCTLNSCTKADGEQKCWVGLPAAPYKDAGGKDTWANIVDFRDRATRDRFQVQAIAAALEAIDGEGAP